MQLLLTCKGELQDHVDIRSCDIVPGATLHLRVWPTWRELVEVAASNDIDWVRPLVFDIFLPIMT